MVILYNSDKILKLLVIIRGEGGESIITFTIFVRHQFMNESNDVFYSRGKKLSNFSLGICISRSLRYLVTCTMVRTLR